MIEARPKEELLFVGIGGKMSIEAISNTRLSRSLKERKIGETS
jgi:hypothetical protein